MHNWETGAVTGMRLAIQDTNIPQLMNSISFSLEYIIEIIEMRGKRGP